MGNNILNSVAVQKLMFDYETCQNEELTELCRDLPKKVLRWIGINHPDNRTRKIFYELTGVTIGIGTVINQNFFVSDNYEPLLKIGENCAISPNVTVICASAPNNSSLNKNAFVKENLIITKEVIIENNVWVGTGAIIMPGITVGNGSIIGAGAVVTKSVPTSVIVSGIPAKVTRQL